MKAHASANGMTTKMDFILFIDADEDDNHIHSETIATSQLPLKSEFYTDAREALAYLKSCLVKEEVPPAAVPILVFIDLNMPLYNFFDLMAVFRKLPDPHQRKGNIKFVLMTGMQHTHMADVVKKDYSDVIISVVQKPVTHQVLKTLKEQYL